MGRERGVKVFWIFVGSFAGVLGKVFVIMGLEGRRNWGGILGEECVEWLCVFHLIRLEIAIYAAKLDLGVASCLSGGNSLIMVF